MDMSGSRQAMLDKMNNLHRSDSTFNTLFGTQQLEQQT